MAIALSDRQLEFGRYVINGVVAAAVHYGILTLLIQVAHVPLAAIANFLAAVVGIGVSFLGSRYFVFRGHTAGFGAQLWRFVSLYTLFALIHAGVLGLWTDILGFDFRIGFVLATGLQVAMSFLSNKYLVFAR